MLRACFLVLTAGDRSVIAKECTVAELCESARFIVRIVVDVDAFIAATGSVG